MHRGGVRHPWLALGVVVAVVAVYNLARSTALPDGVHLVTNVVHAALVLTVGIAFGMRAADLGLARAHLSRGIAFGLTAAGAIAVVLAIAGAVPGTRSLFDDPRALIDGPQMLWQVLVVIPIGTAIAEEIIFRGVVLGLLAGPLSARSALLWSAVLFGLWHVVPERTGGSDWPQVVGTLVATTVAGLAFGWLAQRSRSLVAPICAHTATNSGALAVAWWWFGR